MGAETLALAAIAAGTTAQIGSTLQQGREAEQIGKERAAIDIANAEATERATVEQAKMQGKRGRRLLATQKSQAAAGNVRINVGSPLVIEAETRDQIAENIGFTLEGGQVESDFLRSSAALEIRTGKSLKRQSRFSALSQGLVGFSSIALATRTPKTGKLLPRDRGPDFV